MINNTKTKGSIDFLVLTRRGEKPRVTVENKGLLFIAIYYFFWSFHSSENEIQIIISIYFPAIPGMTMHRDKRSDSRSTGTTGARKGLLAFPSEP